MFVHIGKDCMIQSNKIITILNLEKSEKNLQNIKSELKISDNIIDISKNNNKSFILINDNGIKKGYITNISSITLAKRIQKDII